MASELLWGIDLGGTKIEGVVFEPQAFPEVRARLRIETRADLGYEAIVSRIASLVSKLAEEVGETPQAVGIGTPGVRDPKTGLHKNSNTLCLNGRPLREDLAEAIGAKVELANDANCFALAEGTLGAGRGSFSSFGVIMGTGVGGGVVIGGRALHGTQGIAGEWGHNVLDPSGPPCYCGKSGCVERILCGPALEDFYAAESGTRKPMAEICAAAEQGSDAAATATIARLVEYFGRAIAVVINILDPDVIVIGGGVSNVAAIYTQGVASAKRYVFNDALETKIVRNALGDSAGVFGAAMLFAKADAAQ